MGKDKDNPIQQAEDAMTKWKRRIYRVRNCGIIWMLISILLFIIGVVLLVYYAKDINGTDTARRAGGLSGVTILCLGILGLIIAVIAIIVFVHLFKKMQKRMNGQVGPNTKYTPDHLPPGSYPKQPPDTMEPSANPAAEPTAPNVDGHQNKGAELEDIHVEHDARF